MSSPEFRIEICGNIASGKTTLCTHLSGFGFRTVEEKFLQNPFITKFYEDPSRYSFETEISFLLQHYHSIKSTIAHNPLACDYSLILDTAYADVTLPTTRQRLFLDLKKEIEREIGNPKLIIHLECPEEVLLQRIIKRGREFETLITIDYLKALTSAIDLRVSEAAKKTKIVSINSHEIDFTEGLQGIDSLPEILSTVPPAKS